MNRSLGVDTPANISDAMAVIKRILDETFSLLSSARREQMLARLEGRRDAENVFGLEVKKLEYDVDALAFALEVLNEV